MKVVYLGALLAFSLVAGCDTGSLGGEACGDLVLAEALPDTSVYWNERLELPFEVVGRTSVGGTASSEDPEIVTASVEGNRLVLQPQALGRTRITLTLESSCGATTSATLEVVVKNPCPPLYDPTHSYFPIHLGLELRFAYEAGTYGSGGSERVVGEMIWQIREELCRRGTRIYAMQEYFDGEFQIRPPGSSEWETREPRDWTHSRNFGLTDSLIDLDVFSFAPVRYIYDDTAPDTVRIVQDGTRGENAACSEASSGGPCRETITLVKNRGLVSREVHDEISAALIGGSRLKRTN